jgi:hypothetical protein
MRAQQIAGLQRLIMVLIWKKEECDENDRKD